jgi:protein-S-isoprenylcysteine O-methyltransferase Ste14
MPSWQKIARRIRVPLGFVFAALYLWLAHPSRFSLLWGSALVLAGLIIRVLASGHVRKNEELTTSGPYAYTRNPLYLGSIVLAAGFVVASRNWIVAVIALALLFVIYLPVIRGEEQFLRSQFAEFEHYAQSVPRLFPYRAPYGSSPGSFNWHLYWKHREYNAAIGAALMIAALTAKVLLLHR